MKIGHHTYVVEGSVVPAGCDGEVAQVRHEGITFPTEEEFNFHFIETLGIEGCAGAHAERVGRPELELLFVSDRVQIEKLRCNGSDATFDIGSCDIENETVGGVVASIDAQGEVGPGQANEVGITGEDAEKGYDEAKGGVGVVADKEFPFTVVSIFLFLETKVDFSHGGWVRDGMGGSHRGAGVSRAFDISKGESVSVVETVAVIG